MKIRVNFVIDLLKVGISLQTAGIITLSISLIAIYGYAGMTIYKFLTGQ